MPLVSPCYMHSLANTCLRMQVEKGVGVVEEAGVVMGVVAGVGTWTQR